MESHTDTATVEAPAESDNPIDSLPQETTQDSFLDALDAALDNINNPEFVESVDQEAQEAVEKEEQKAEEATEESTEEAVEETSEEKTEEDSDKEVEDNKEKINSDDPIEELSDEVGDEWTPKAANRFKQLKEELRTNKSELDTLRQTVKEQESKMSELTAIAENKDVEALQEQLRQYEIEKSFSDLENTYQYKEVVTEPLNRLMDRAEVIAEKYEVDYDALVDIISMDDSTKQDQALSELLPEASGRDKSTIYRVIEDIDPILQKRNELFENADEALQEAQYIQEQKAQMELAEKAEVRNVITKNVVQRVSEKLPFLSGVEGLDMSAIESKASDLDPSVVHPVDFAYNSVAAQLLPTIVREYLSSRAEAEVLMNKLSEYEDAEPTVSGAPKSDTASKRPSDLSFEEAISAALSGE
tara:strand:- start:42 stop:1289 length:1248 start_codon:yes stop_codon:yes gene_type:complete